jgi:poly[(R)-3-hydroxyalkanoate] polymerase subunit PhaC
MLLHLTLAMLRSQASLAGWTNWNPASPTWPPAAGLPGAKATDDAALRASLAAEIEFLAGIRAWRAHRWRRDLADPPVRWREGGARLLDYGGTGPRVLFVPSLVNRWTILDLMRGHSMMRWLAAEGVHPMLLDWGAPEPDFTLTDHIAGRLTRAMAAAGGRHVLAGYCMGGTFAVAAAALRPDLVSGLMLLAAPWDFFAGDPGRVQTITLARRLLEPLLAHLDTVPVDLLQMLFAFEDTAGIARKFRAFARLDPDSDGARLFVALEEWLNDGVPLSGATARACLREWYGENLPMRGEWRVAGLRIDPAAIAVPALVVVPRRDRIVPPDSAIALARKLPRGTPREVAAGHIGMTAGRAAADVLWRPARDWLLATAETKRRARPARRRPPA